MKERAAGAAVRFRDLDPHDVEVKSRSSSVRGIWLPFHLTDERTDLVVGELVHAVIDQPLFVGERRKRCHGLY